LFRHLTNKWICQWNTEVGISLSTSVPEKDNITAFITYKEIIIAIFINIAEKAGFDREPASLNPNGLKNELAQEG